MRRANRFGLVPEEDFLGTANAKCRNPIPANAVRNRNKGILQQRFTDAQSAREL
jgi:hypothetical protein